MQKLLVNFNYLKRYHSDLIDALCILLGIVILRLQNKTALKNLLFLAKKRKPIASEFEHEMRALLGDLFIPPNPKINLIKILRTMDESSPTPAQIEQLIDIITQKKTINKLYSFAMPLEINRLVVDILDIKNGDEIYNPCYGIGSLFLSLFQSKKTFSVYGEELDSRLDCAAKLILKMLNIDSSNLFVNNILKNQIFPPNRRFNKIICNPPIDTYIGVLDLKNNERFAKYGLITKSVPDLSFIVNGISYMRDKGVFVIRNYLLQKTSVEEKFKEQICKEKLIEAIIELPKNIFPHSSTDCSIMILSKNNDSILHIDARSFYQKDGKYNRLTNSDLILNMLKKRADSQYCKCTKINDINVDDLRAQSYFKQKSFKGKSNCLKSIGAKILRGVRIYSTKASKSQKYVNIGIINFNENGFIDCNNIEESIGDGDKIEQYKLRAFDILLSLRGVVPKIAIVGESKRALIANAGILIIRCKNRDDALGLYCYLFTRKAQNALSELYWQTDRKFININHLYDFELPLDFRKNASEKFSKINALGSEILRLERELELLR